MKAYNQNWSWAFGHLQSFCVYGLTQSELAVQVRAPPLLSRCRNASGSNGDATSMCWHAPRYCAARLSLGSVAPQVSLLWLGTGPSHNLTRLEEAVGLHAQLAALAGVGAPLHPPQKFMYEQLEVLLQTYTVLCIDGTDIILYFDNRQDAKGRMTSSCSSRTFLRIPVTCLRQIFHLIRKVEKRNLIQQKVENRCAALGLSQELW